LLAPTESGHPFRGKQATDSKENPAIF